MLGLTLFNPFISNVDSGIEGILSKLWLSKERKDAMQRDLAGLERWGLCKPPEVQQGQVQGPALSQSNPKNE